MAFATINFMETKDFSLKLSIQPYAFVVTLFLLLALCGAFGSFLQNDIPGILVITLGSVAVLSPIIFIGNRYRVWWDGKAVVQRAANYAITRIEIDEIEKIVTETSNAQTLLSLRRPFRRIAIYSHSIPVKFVDVSLKHFKPDDVRKLMRIIHELRPDLEMPKQWL